MFDLPALIASQSSQHAAAATRPPAERDPVVLYVPGTSTHHVSSELKEQVARQLGPNAQVELVPYPATWDLRSSVAAGVDALGDRLDSLARDGDVGRVMVVGESQGAWVIGEVLADPGHASEVDRAVLMGHPSFASTHYTSSDVPWASSAKVVEVANPDDHVPRPTRGSSSLVIDAMTSLGQGDVGGIVPLLRVAAADPAFVATAGVNALRGTVLESIAGDPHDYSGRMDEAVALLATDATFGGDVPEPEQRATSAVE